MVEEKEIVIWQPSDKQMMAEYPALGKIEEFKELEDYQLKFCWYYANPTSPFVKHSKSNKSYTVSQRRKDSVEKAMTNASEKMRQSYIKGEWGDKVEEALKRMANTKLRDRLVAKRLFDSGYKNIEIIINRSPEEISGMEMKDQKIYMSMFMEFTKSMDEIIEKREQGYGVKIKVKEKEKSEDNISIENIIKNSHK